MKPWTLAGLSFGINAAAGLPKIPSGRTLIGMGVTLAVIAAITGPASQIAWGLAGLIFVTVILSRAPGLLDKLNK